MNDLESRIRDAFRDHEGDAQSSIPQTHVVPWSVRGAVRH